MCIACTFVALLIGVASHAHASAFLAAQPVVLRQTYPDGAYTELNCPDQDLQSCSFRVSSGLSGRRYTMNFGAYSRSRMPEQYWVWLYSRMRVESVAVPVDCGPKDLAMLPSEDEAHVTCRLFLRLVGNSLRPEQIEARSVRSEGAPVYRDIAGP